MGMRQPEVEGNHTGLDSETNKKENHTPVKGPGIKGSDSPAANGWQYIRRCPHKDYPQNQEKTTNDTEKEIKIPGPDGFLIPPVDDPEIGADSHQFKKQQHGQEISGQEYPHHCH